MILILCRLALFLLGVIIMRLEGQSQPQPGVWFVVAMILIIVSISPWKD